MAKDKALTMIDQTPKAIAMSGRHALTLDVALYEKYLEASDVSDDQKQKLLEALWSVIVGFVDLGFEVHPLQQANSEACEQELDLTSFMASDVVSLKKGISQNQFTDAADCSNKQDVERTES